MKMTFRWYGKKDPVTLEKIRQIPGVSGIVWSLHDRQAGEEWSWEEIAEVKDCLLYTSRPLYFLISHSRSRGFHG